MFSASDRRIVRQTSWTGAMRAVELVAGLAQIAMTARMLGLEGYGQLAVIVSVGTLVHGLLALPGGETVTTFATRSVAAGRRREAGAILRFTLALSLGMALLAYAVIAALTLAVGGLIGIDDTQETAMLLYGTVGILVAAKSESLAVLRLSDRMSLALAVTLAATLVRVGLVALAWEAGGGLPEVIAAYVAGAAVTGVGMFAITATSAPKAGIAGFLRSPSVRVPPGVAAFQAGVFGKATLGHLSSNLDSILVAHFAGAAGAGLYRAARQIVDNTRFPFSALTSGVHVEFSRRWYSSDGAALRRTALRFTLLAAGGAAALFGALAVFREPLARLVLGDGFSGVAPLILIMIPGSLVAGSLAPLTILPEATGRVRPSLVAHIAAFAASLVALLVLAPRMGPAGAAWANTVFLIVWCAVAAPYIVSILRRSRAMKTSPARDDGPPTRSARDFYVDSRVREGHDAKFSRGKPLLDDLVVDDLIRSLFTRYLDGRKSILEIGAYTGRITRKLAKYSDNITVSDTSAEILRGFHYPTTVLDLGAGLDRIEDGRVYDAIVSIGHQVSICNDVTAAIDVFDKLLSPDGVLVFDVWNDSIPKSYDPPYPLQKRSRPWVEEALGKVGFEVKEYRSGCRLPYVFGGAFAVLFGGSGNRLVFDALFRLEKLMFRLGLFEGREQAQIFVAVRSRASREREGGSIRSTA